MIKVISQKDSSIIEMVIEGKMDKEGIETFEERLQQKITEQEPVNLLIKAENMEGITLKGLIQDLKMVRYLRSIKKTALVSDKSWLQTDAKIENLIPGVKVDYFSTDQTDAARKWLNT